MHTYETSLPSEHSSRFGDGYPHCLFSVGSIFFFFFSSITFLVHTQGIPALCVFNPNSLPSQASTPILCILLGHQGLADVTRQVPAPAGLFLEWSSLLVSDNFPFFSDIALPLKRKMLFCISSSILSALYQEVSPDSYCQKYTIYIFTHLEFNLIRGVRQRSKNSATIFTVPPFSSEMVSVNQLFKQYFFPIFCCLLPAGYLKESQKPTFK